MEVYNPDLVYCANHLLVPTMSEVVTPPRENYELVREGEARGVGGEGGGL